MVLLRNFTNLKQHIQASEILLFVALAPCEVFENGSFFRVGNNPPLVQGRTRMASELKCRQQFSELLSPGPRPEAGLDGALMRPFEIAVLPILYAYITLQLDSLTRANSNRTMRLHYPLDGNAVSSS